MTQKELEALTRGIAKQILQSLAPLEARITALESRPKGVTYRGVHDLTAKYEAGDVVSAGGSMWVALKFNAGIRPADSQGEHWQLAVKAGRDGKDLR